MSNILDRKNNKELLQESEIKSQFSSSGLYIKEDDQDWGSSGMNDIQDNTRINH